MGKESDMSDSFDPIDPFPDYDAHVKPIVLSLHDRATLPTISVAADSCEQSDLWIHIYDRVCSPEICKMIRDELDEAPFRSKFEEPWRRCHMVEPRGVALEAITQAVRMCFDRYRLETQCNSLNHIRRMEVPNVYRYDHVDEGGVHHFHLHADAWSDESISRQLSLILYLNDVELGETRFARPERSIEPREGRMLLFPSTFAYEHEGRPPISGPKYVVVTWLHLGEGPHKYRTLPF